MKRCQIAACCAVVSVGLLSSPIGSAAAFTLPPPEIPPGWAEASWPCNIARGATLPGPVLWRQVGESVTAPAYFTYGEPFPLEALPASDFTATVSWGDGTTAPALVEKAEGTLGCYAVSAPGHVYASAGNYALSYTVVELNTGQDHKLAAFRYPEFHIWSTTPQLIGGPSSLAIDASVGTPWSGVVARFSYDGPANPFILYHAQIEWGDGEAPTEGTITNQISEHAFTVGGSHTYAYPLTGAIRVLLSYGWSARESDSLGAWAIGGVDVASPTASEVTPAVRFRGQPLLAVIRHGHRAPLYELVFRLNRALVQSSAGHMEATINADGDTSPVRQLTSNRVTACYVATAGTAGKQNLKPGSRYPFTLVISGAPSTQDRTYGIVRSFTSVKHMHRAASKQLGCA